MTSQRDKTAKVKDAESDDRSRQSDEHRDLDAEIVRDLEVGERGEDVRGGAPLSAYCGPCMNTFFPK